MFSEETLVDLLREEMRRRDGDTSRLVFVGTHNVAQYWWCAMYSVLKSRANEIEFFAAYLEDRLAYALKLGRITKIPRKRTDVLSAGHDITLSDMQQLHPRTLESRDILHDPDPASFRWSFSWDRYVIVGNPDGLARDTVLERKTAANDYFAKTVARPVGRTQADLYGFFFGRSRKIVEIKVSEGGSGLNLDEEVDSTRAVETLRKFRAVDDGGTPIPPKAEKCRRCEFKDSCSISQA